MLKSRGSFFLRIICGFNAFNKYWNVGLKWFKGASVPIRGFNDFNKIHLHGTHLSLAVSVPMRGFNDFNSNLEKPCQDYTIN